jgi:hypothetical protein
MMIRISALPFSALPFSALQISAIKFSAVWVYALSLVMSLAVGLGAQTVEIEPSVLSRVPVGQRFWQQLVVQFDHADAPGEEVVALSLPTGAFIPDQDNDGRLSDEVRLVYVAAEGEEPVFFVSAVSAEGRIAIGSVAAAAAGGRLYVQFPVNGFSQDDGDTLSYGPVEFVDERERDILAGPAVVVVGDDVLQALGSLNLVRFAPIIGEAAFSAALGFSFPDFDQILVEEVPDLLFDGGVSTASTLIGFGDGDDTNDMEYHFFFSPDPALLQVDAVTAIPALLTDGQPYSEGENGGRPVQLLIRDLPVGTYYLYATSALTGGRPLGRSGPLVVRHEPRVLAVDPALSDVTLDSGGLFGLDGEPDEQARTYFDIGFTVVDYDDSATVHLFYSTESNLKDLALESAIQLVIREEGASLEGAQALTPIKGIGEGAGPFIWDILEPELVPEGDYYIYAVAGDGDRVDMWRSEFRILVRHAPFLRLDPLDDQVLSGADTVRSGGVRPQRFVSLTWGRSGIDGDGDADGDAQIDFYWSTVPAAGATAGFAVPGGAADLLEAVGSAAGQIASGIGEDADGRQADRYIWDLWTGAAPEAGKIQYIYGLISDRDTRRLTQMNGGRLNDAASRIVFEHEPHIRPLEPLGDIVLTTGASAQVAWEDMDVDDNARIRLLLSARDLGKVTEYADLGAGPAWVLNSADGLAAGLVDTLFDLSEDSLDDTYDIDTSHLQRGLGTETPPPPGEYWIYIACEDGDTFGTGTLAWKAPGKVELQSGDAAPAFAFRLLPEVFVLGNAGRPQAFELRVDAAGKAVDLVRATLKLDGEQLQVVDQDTTAEGIQPFRVGPGFDAAKQVPTAVVSDEDGSLLLRFEYFEPTAETIPGLDGSRALGVVELIGGPVAGPALVELADASNGGISQLLDGGREVLVPVTRVVASGTLVPGRAQVRGTLVLEGRSAVPTRVAVSLRPWASYAEFEDSLFSAANDVEPETAGVQIDLAEDGAFELVEVPSGLYDVFFRRSGYLDAWAFGLDLLPAADMGEVIPQSPDGEGRMLGGDVAGYRDATGASLPDNEVSLADWDFVAALFGGDTDTPDAARADITGDGAVDVQDLALVGANFMRRGPDPVFKVGVAEPGMIWSPVVKGGTSDVFEVVVQARSMAAVQAFELRVEWDEDAWELIDAGGPESWLQAIASKKGQLLFAASRKGRPVETTTGADLRLSWRALGAGGTDLQMAAVPPQMTSARAVMADGRLVQAAESAALPLPDRLDLGQNFPNPFNPETHIRLELPKALDQARLEVFNSLGQRVTVLWQGPVAAGQHLMRWDGTTALGGPAAGGVYFYRWRGGGQELVKRMVLLR